MSKNDIIPLDVSIVVSEHKGTPIIELRRQINDSELIKGIISAAFHDKAVIIRPMFRDKIKAVASLTQKGILIYDQETNDFKFML